MVEVFKTDISEATRANEFIALLSQHLPGSKINFDLEDCDKVLRVEGENISAEKIIDLFKKRKRSCEALE